MPNCTSSLSGRRDRLLLLRHLRLRLVRRHRRRRRQVLGRVRRPAQIFHALAQPVEEELLPEFVEAPAGARRGCSGDASGRPGSCSAPAEARRSANARQNCVIARREERKKVMMAREPGEHLASAFRGEPGVPSVTRRRLRRLTALPTAPLGYELGGERQEYEFEELAHLVQNWDEQWRCGRACCTRTRGERECWDSSREKVLTAPGSGDGARSRLSPSAAAG